MNSCPKSFVFIDFKRREQRPASRLFDREMKVVGRDGFYLEIQRIVKLNRVLPAPDTVKA